MRAPLRLHHSVQDMLILMSEGNPGGLSVLCRLWKEQQDTALLTILGLDDMNIRGSQVWVAFKDHCGEDLGRLAQAVSERDPELVATVNRHCAEYGETAVEAGASFTREPAGALA